jgi:hypothetical protein
MAVEDQEEASGRMPKESSQKRKKKKNDKTVI